MDYRNKINMRFSHFILILRILPVCTFFITPSPPEYHLKRPEYSYLSLSSRNCYPALTVFRICDFSWEYPPAVGLYDEVARLSISSHPSVLTYISFILFFMNIDPSVEGRDLILLKVSCVQSPLRINGLWLISFRYFSLCNFTACFNI